MCHVERKALSDGSELAGEQTAEKDSSYFL